MIQLKIAKITKTFYPKSSWQPLGEEVKFFRTLKLAKKYLKSTYGNCTREVMYEHDKGLGKKIGWIFRFRKTNYQSIPMQALIENDFVTIIKE